MSTCYRISETSEPLCGHKPENALVAEDSPIFHLIVLMCGPKNVINKLILQMLVCLTMEFWNDLSLSHQCLVSAVYYCFFSSITFASSLTTIDLALALTLKIFNALSTISMRTNDTHDFFKNWLSNDSV